MTDDGDAADARIAVELDQFVQRSDRIGAQIRLVEVEERIAVQAHVVAHEATLGVSASATAGRRAPCTAWISNGACGR